MSIDDIMEGIGLLISSKQRDYGTENILESDQIGVAIRLADKVNRLKNLLKSQRQARHEPLEDTWMDIISYGCIGYMLHKNIYPPEIQEEGKKVELVYLSGPINNTQFPAYENRWRQVAAQYLKGIGVISYSPFHAFNGISTKLCIAINQEALRRSQVVLTYLPSHIFPKEVIIDIAEAFNIGKKVVVWSDPPPALEKIIGELRLPESLIVVSSLEEAVGCINKMNEGK